jgi:hypothetical protein
MLRPPSIFFTKEKYKVRDELINGFVLWLKKVEFSVKEKSDSSFE